MRRLLGLLSLPLALSALAASTAAAPARTPAVTTLGAVGVSAAAKVGVADIEARARRVTGLASRSDRTRLATLADADTVAFLLARANWKVETPDCKVSAVSRPGSKVYVCAIKEVNFSHRWWLYFRQVEGRWTAVNHRIASSATVYRNERTLELRRDQIMRAGLNGRFDLLEPIVAPAVLADLKSLVNRVRAGAPEDADLVLGLGSSCRASTNPAVIRRYGRYLCGWSLEPAREESADVIFERIDGVWIATKLAYLYDEEV